MTRYTIDRFENDAWAILEDPARHMITVPRDWLPTGAREGAVLTLTHHDDADGARILRFYLDTAASAARLERAQTMRDRLPRGPKGDIAL